MNKVPFTKMHGCGNDYIYVNAMLHEIHSPSEAAIRWSDRHKGIGSDGLVLIDRSPIPEADFEMRIFNADGSEAMMCGNASRCIGKYLYEKTHPWPLPVKEGNGYQETEIRLLTLSGIKILYLHIVDGIVESVTIDMGAPVFEDESLFNPTIGKSLSTPLHYREGQGGGSALFVSMGNPHYVIFVDDIQSIDVATEGTRLEHHPCFPERCNIEFAEMRPNGIRMRVWERGSGITLACGTGACATAVAAAATGRSGRQSRIIMDGGTLDIEWSETDNHVYMTGPATFVYEGEIEQPLPPTPPL